MGFHLEHLLEGYRRLTLMMLDAGVVAVSPASVRRVLQEIVSVESDDVLPRSPALNKLRMIWFKTTIIEGFQCNLQLRVEHRPASI